MFFQRAFVNRKQGRRILSKISGRMSHVKQCNLSSWQIEACFRNDDCSRLVFFSLGIVYRSLKYVHERTNYDLNFETCEWKVIFHFHQDRQIVCLRGCEEIIVRKKKSGMERVFLLNRLIVIVRRKKDILGFRKGEFF